MTMKKIMAGLLAAGFLFTAFPMADATASAVPIQELTVVSEKDNGSALLVNDENRDRNGHRERRWERRHRERRWERRHRERRWERRHRERRWERHHSASASFNSNVSYPSPQVALTSY
jgi:hypothetical protein